jgi:hypothetical protein
MARRAFTRISQRYHAGTSNRATKALRDAIASEPKLTLADGGGPKLLETV